MDITIFPQHWSAILCIAIMIGAIIFGIIRKLMMVYVLIISNVIIFILTLFYYPEIIQGLENQVQVYAGLGFRPIYLSLSYLPQLYTLFTSMFIHGGFAHIFGNMIIFLFMGMAFENRIGWKNLLLIYFITGICAALTHSLLNLGSPITLIGASGAIFGILGAFAYSYPRDEVVLPIPLYVIMVFRRVKVIYAALLFAIIETLIVLFEVQDNTAHFAHIGGLVSGVILASLLIGKRGDKMKHTHETKIYYDISQVPKSKRINFSVLKKLATTPELKNELQQIEQESVLQVRDAWLDHFLDRITCPKCNKPLHHINGKIWCEDNHFETKY